MEQPKDLILNKKPLTELRFDSLELHPKIMQGLGPAGFTHCTPIQQQTLPLALAGQDVAGQAQTGTGKTAAFLLVIFQRLLNRKPANGRSGGIRSLVLAPTRELALQIHRDAQMLGAETGLVLGLAYGGVDYEKQRKQLEQGVDVLIGTPGRIIDYYKQRVFHLKQVDVMVLDEADRMFDLGFIKDIRYLLRRLPPPDQRLSLMFSATLGYRVTELAYEHMNDPKLIQVEADKVTADNVVQSVYYPANHEKLPLLVALLRTLEDGRIMVFCNTRVSADQVARTLQANGLQAAAISGRVHQRKRQSLLRRFHQGELPILVATDVAARGLHIPDVSHVINFDLPQDDADYVHRIGRTARLGAKGEAISFACEDYAFHLPDIEDYIGYSIPMIPVDETTLPEIQKAPPAPKRRGGPSRGGRRRGKPGRGQHSKRPPRGKGDTRRRKK